ncbi:MAG: FtsQ-type POTRA domain-containing protein [Thermodesulfobacteriota bacterium]|nr:FtsQ-type POTRA domain-containing protein [Thermodesulfobacteriota bacterium]
MKKSLKRTPSTKKNRLKRRSGMIPGDIFRTLAIVSVAGLLAFFMVYAYNFAMCADYFQLKNTIVRGCNKVSKEKIVELAGISPSMNVLTANLWKMVRDIENDPWIKDASVGREFPDRLVIEVVERNTAALLKKDKNLYAVDRSGEVFKKFEVGDSTDAPVLTGFYRNERVRKALLETAFEFLDYLSEGDNFPRAWNVSEIYVDDLYEFSVVTDNRLFLNLGFGDYGKKLKRLKRVMIDLARRNPDGASLSIDLVDCSRITVQRGNIFSPKSLTKDYKTEI